jgi:hypothetical protein
MSKVVVGCSARSFRCQADVRRKGRSPVIACPMEEGTFRSTRCHLENEMDRTHLLALELYETVSAIRDAAHLRTMLEDRKVLARESRHEEGRSIELQILDDDGETIDFAAFSDGPSGVFGIGGVASRIVIRFDSPKRYAGGVPVQDITIPLPGC